MRQRRNSEGVATLSALPSCYCAAGSGSRLRSTNLIRRRGRVPSGVANTKRRPAGVRFLDAAPTLPFEASTSRLVEVRRVAQSDGPTIGCDVLMFDGERIGYVRAVRATTSSRASQWLSARDIRGAARARGLNFTAKSLSDYKQGRAGGHRDLVPQVHSATRRRNHGEPDRAAIRRSQLKGCE